jgi:hypothetical protein
MAKPDPSEIDQSSEMTDEAREVIGKARRSFGFSMSILILGFMAIVLALVYRATKDQESVADKYVLESIILPAGAQVISIVPERDVIAVTYTLEGQSALRMISIETGEVLKEISIIAEE